MKDKIVCIRWLDSYGVQSGWQPTEDYRANKLEITSLGKVVYEDDNVISIAGNFAEETENTEEQANGIMTIPKACITSISSVTLTSFCQEPELRQKQQQSLTLLKTSCL